MNLEGYPELEKITPDKVITGCAKLAINYDVELGNHVQVLSGKKT